MRNKERIEKIILNLGLYWATYDVDILSLLYSIYDPSRKRMEFILF